MGGSVAVGFRFDDDSVFVQDRWTNAMPYWFKNAKLFNGDREHIDAYLRRGEKYPVQVPLAPLGYGLVFIDVKTKHFLSMQNYCSFDREAPVHMALLNKKRDLETYNEEAERYQNLLDERRLSWRTFRLVKKGHSYEKIIENERLLTGNFDDLYEANKLIDHFDMQRLDNLPRDDRHHEFRIDTQPMTYIDYGDTSTENGQKMLAKLRELGVLITTESERAWEQWFRGYEECNMAP